MKRLLCVLFCLMLLAQPMLASAQEAPDAPSSPLPDLPGEGFILVPPASSASEAIIANIDGKTVQMDFDNSPEYSSVEGGAVQASFYAFIDGTDLLYELYLTFPETVQPGAVVTPEYASPEMLECSVVLIISDDNSETYYYSSQMDGGVYPPGSDFSIAVDSVTEGDAGTTYSGRLNASLVAMDMLYDQASGAVSIVDSPFSFTMSAEPQVSRPTPAPELSPDMRRV